MAEPKPEPKAPATRKPAAAKSTSAKSATTKPAAAKPAAAKTTAAKPVAAKTTAAKPATARTTSPRTPAAAKTTAAKPTAAKTTAAKPAAAKTAAAKPAAAKTASSRTPAASKPATTKATPARPSATKPAAPKPPAAQPAETETAPTLSETLATAARQSGLSQLKPGETPSARAILGAIGGVRGIIESIVPGIAFLAIYLPTRNLLLAVLIPAFVALVLVVIRAGARSSMSSAITGAVLLAITAVLTLITGRAVNNFVPGILINAGGFIIMLGSIVLRWPLIGFIVGVLFGEGDGWRQDPPKRRILTAATWIWVGLFAVRLAIEVPLYFADNVTALGIVRLVTSVPLYAVCLWATWLLVRGVYAVVTGNSVASTDETDE